MTACELKEYILENEKIEIIIDDLGCHHLKEHSKEYRCGLPSHSNTTSISIKKDTLKTKIYQSESETIRGDIFTLVMHIKDISLPETLKYLHKLFGLEYKIDKKKTKEENKKDPLEIFKKIKRQRYVVNNDELNIYDNEILREYTPMPHIDWIREGIMPWTCEKFKIGYSYDRKRIVIPERYWCGDEGEYLGIMGRTTIKEYKLLDIPKYYPLKKYFKGMNLYGLQENYEGIQRGGCINVFEAQKSVLKRHSRLDETAVAIGSHDITDEQVKILIGLDVDIIIQMDKGVDINHIRSMCDKFYGLRNVYYVFDKYDVLQDKDSPADAQNKIYNFLWKHKIKYDEKERGEYLKWLESQNKNSKN
jgi:hypothetical protein